MMETWDTLSDAPVGEVLVNDHAFFYKTQPYALWMLDPTPGNRHYLPRMGSGSELVGPEWAAVREMGFTRHAGVGTLNGIILGPIRRWVDEVAQHGVNGAESWSLRHAPLDCLLVSEDAFYWRNTSGCFRLSVDGDGDNPIALAGALRPARDLGFTHSRWVGAWDRAHVQVQRWDDLVDSPTTDAETEPEFDWHGVVVVETLSRSGAAEEREGERFFAVPRVDNEPYYVLFADAANDDRVHEHWSDPSAVTPGGSRRRRDSLIAAGVDPDAGWYTWNTRLVTVVDETPFAQRAEPEWDWRGVVEVETNSSTQCAPTGSRFYAVPHTRSRYPEYILFANPSDPRVRGRWAPEGRYSRRDRALREAGVNPSGYVTWVTSRCTVVDSRTTDDGAAATIERDYPAALEQIADEFWAEAVSRDWCSEAESVIRRINRNLGWTALRETREKPRPVQPEPMTLGATVWSMGSQYLRTSADRPGDAVWLLVGRTPVTFATWAQIEPEVAR